MKLNLFILFQLFLSSNLCIAQEKFDCQWVVGYPTGKIDSVFSPYLMDFCDDTVKMIPLPQATLYTPITTASICDKYGKISLYSNGCQIHNGNFELIEGCEKVNPGSVWDDYCNDGYYPSLQSQIILPFPDEENKYLYLTHRKEFSQKYNWSGYNYYTEFYHAIDIDMSLNNGKGKALSNYDIEYPDVVKGFNLAACKHSNGKDWWIINFSFNLKKFYRLLLTKDGLTGPWEQEGGPPRDNTSSIGQSVFSPDGKKYACIYSSGGNVWILDFDRKTGLFSNLKILNYEFYKDPNDPGWDVRGVSFSPNNRFLYVSAGYYIYQFDIEASNIQSSKILIGTNDGYSYPGWPFYIVFAFQQLAHDGKIYVGEFTGSYRQWSVINKPNEQGMACDFKQHSFLFPSWTLPGPPIQPNFNLGPDSTSSITILPHENIEMKSWYNTSSKLIKCWLQHLPKDKNEYSLNVSDVTGRKLISKNISVLQYQEDISIDGSSLLSGVYFVSLLDKGRLIASDKVMVY